MSKISLSEFPIVPANKQSLALRNSVCGIGVNDADYVTQPIVKGKKFTCPYYRSWVDMLTRCYSITFLNKEPTYIGCTVVAEWLLFSNFRAWMAQQDWQGKEIDKDILVIGNKVYSPDTCIFVTSQINKLLTKKPGSLNGLPQGVCFDKQTNKYMAQITIFGKAKKLGRYTAIECAGLVYRRAKSAHVKDIAMQQSEPLRSGLLRHAALIAGNLFIKTRAALST